VVPTGASSSSGGGSSSTKPASTLTGPACNGCGGTTYKLVDGRYYACSRCGLVKGAKRPAPEPISPVQEPE
jgi:hypothetical protein